MKKFIFTTIFLLFLLAGKIDGQQCLTTGGCSNFFNEYPSTTSPFSTSWSTISGMNGGNWTRFNVIAGNTYEWTYCESAGGISTSWDAQLTLYDVTGGLRYCYSDDNCGTNGNAPYIRWTAPFTETVRLLTSVFNCATNAPNPPFNRLAYRVLPSATYNFTLTVFNVTGATRNNATVKLYNSTFSTLLQTLNTNSSGQVTFTGLNNAGYNFEVYYTPPGTNAPISNEEFWGTGSFTISGGSISQNFTRIQPYISSIPSFSPSSLAIGQITSGNFPVRSGLPYSTNSYVRVWTDRNQSSPYDFQNTTSTQSVGVGSITNYSINVPPTNTGTHYYYAFVYSVVNGTPIITDQYAWTTAFSTSCPSLPIPTSATPGSTSAPGPVLSTLNPTFTWGGSSSGIYHVQIWNAATNPTTDENVIYGFETPTSSPGHCVSGLSHTIPSGVLVNNGQYKWSVHRNDPCGECESVSTLLQYFQINTSPCIQPGTQASNIGFNGNDGISVTANWSNGNGSARIVKVNTTNSFSTPTNGVAPSGVNNTYQNTGEQTVYYGSGSNVYVNNLTPGQTYYFRVYEANCTGSQIVYNTNTNTGNPASVAMITGQAPVADFSANVGVINTGQSIQFIDLSSNTPTQWQWRMYRSGVQGGQQQIGSTLTSQHPQITFSTAGCYRVELTATNASGNDTEIKNCFVYVKPNPNAIVPPDVAMSLQYNTYFGGDPVNTALGFFSYQQSDLSTRGINTNLTIERRYASRITATGQFGYGWYFDYGMKINTGEYEVSLIKGDGSVFTFQLYPNGEARCNAPIFNDSLYYVNNAGVFTYTYIEKNGCKWTFDNSGFLVGKTDLNGNVTQVVRSGIYIQKIIVPGGRELNFSYNASDKISSIRNGIDTAFYYYSWGFLLDSVKIRNSVTKYKYTDTTSYLKEIISPNGQRIIKNEYTADKVTKQWDAFDILTQFQYDTPIPGSTTVTNGLSKTKVLSHDASYLITKQVNEIGGVRRYTHSAEHHIDSLIDERNNAYKFHTQANGDIVKTTDPLQNADSIGYTAFGKPAYIRDKENNVTQIAYSSQLNPVQVTQANGGVITMEYDQFGQDTTVTDPLNNKIRKRFNAQGDIIKIIRPHSTDSIQYDATGRPIVRINGRGFIDSIQYNHYGQPTRVTDGLGYAETFEYDANGNLIKQTDKEGIATFYVFDAKDRLLRIVRAGIVHKENVWNELDYLVRVRDGNRNCLIITNDDLGRPTHIADSVLGVVAEYSYDEAGNRVANKNSFGNIWTHRYDELNRIVSTKDPNNDSTVIKYNKNNQPVELIDEEGKTTKLFYNSTGVHIKTIDKNNATIQIFPNLIGLPDSIRDAKGFFRNITYDSEYRIKTTNEGYGNHQYFYDSAGNIVEYRDLASNILTWVYSGRNEKVQESWNGTVKKDFAYNKNGWLTYGSNQGINLYKHYDSNGWVVKDSATFSGATTYERDSVGNLKRTTLKDGKQITNTYNSLNYNTSVRDWNNQTFALNRDKEGGITSLLYPNNTQTIIVRNAAYQVTAWINSKTSPAEIFQKNNPVYSRRGEITGDTSTINYFPKNSITPGSYRATYAAADRKQVYGSATYTYNGNGSVTSITDTAFTNTFAYNPDNTAQQLTLSGNQFTQTYNAFNNRVQKTDVNNTSRFTISNEFASYPVVLQNLDGDNNTVATNLFSPEGMLLARDSAGVQSYYHYNAYGNTVALSNAVDSITDTYAYPLFGNAYTHKGNSTQPFTWQGMYGVQNDANNLYYIWQRFYDANTGTFLSKDPIQGALSETRSLNSYLYGLNDPLSFNDPTGLYPLNTNTANLNWFQRFAVSNTGGNTINFLQGLLKGYHTVADIAGLIPGFGEPADIYNGLLYGVQGDKINSLLSFGSSIPFGGYAATTAKFVRKGDNIVHHIASNKHLSKYTPQFGAIASKYGLKLDAAWNKLDISDAFHYSKHPTQYHEFVLQGMRAADASANGNQAKFMQLFDQYVKQPLLQNPNILNKKGW